MNFILKEDGSYLLLETGGKIVLQEGSSPSASVSPSASTSPSISPSSSLSPSASISPSASSSPSPSSGFSNNTREENSVLPSGDNDLSTMYTEIEDTYISKRDNIYVGQVGALEYMIHQFKTFVGQNSKCKIEWEGMSTLAPDLSPVYLQIYNQISGLWETIDIMDDADEDINFQLRGKIPDLTNYVNSMVISCRVYQLAI